MSMCQPWAIQNGLIYSKPGNLFFYVIERIVATEIGAIMELLRYLRDQIV